MASKSLGIFGSSGILPVRKVLYRDRSNSKRAALRKRQEELIRNAQREEKEQEPPDDPPTADEASLKSELDDTDNRLHQLEMKIKNLIQSEKVPDAERLNKELDKCRQEKSELEHKLNECRHLHSNVGMRLQQLEQNFNNVIQPNRREEAERLREELRQCMDKKKELVIYKFLT